MTRAISGISASAWPRTIGSDSLRGTAPLLGVEHGGRAGLERGIDGKDAHDSISVVTAKAVIRARVMIAAIRMLAVPD